MCMYSLSIPYITTAEYMNCPRLRNRANGITSILDAHTDCPTTSSADPPTPIFPYPCSGAFPIFQNDDPSSPLIGLALMLLTCHAHVVSHPLPVFLDLRNDSVDSRADTDAYNLCTQSRCAWDTLSLSDEHVSLSGLPSIDTLVRVLVEERRRKDTQLSREIYLQLCNYGLEAHSVLGNYLVPVLVDCGSIPIALQVFRKLALQREHAWTCILRAFLECGQPQHVLDSVKQMQENEVHPSLHTFVSVIKACEILRDIETGRILHMDVSKRGCETDPFISNCMLYMYIKCGYITDAENIFDQLTVVDVISLTAMMAGYVECGFSEEALNFWDQIQGDNMQPDSVMFICCLRACGSSGALQKGQEVHEKIIIEGFEKDNSVANTLIDMYLKCGLIAEAEQIIDEHIDRDLVSWTSLIRGYVENGFPQRAVECLEEAQLAGVIPDTVMYACCLKACCCVGAVDKGFEMHREISQKGFCTDQVVGNMLIDMYVKHDLLPEAQVVFLQLPKRDVISWTALISGYVEHGLHEDVRNFLRQMKLQGLSPNIATYVCCLKGSGQVDSLSWGLEIHSQLVREGYEKDPIIGSALVDMYARCGSFLEAEAVLNSSSVQNVFSWSALIAGYAENGALENVIRCLDKMEKTGISSCAITLVSCLKACDSKEALQRGYKIHDEIIKKGFEREVALGNALVSMYVKCGSLSASLLVFDLMTHRDVISWTTLMAAYAEHDLKEEAINCLVQMQLEHILPDKMSWNTIIESLATQGVCEDALLLYMRMQEQSCLPDSLTFANILQACCKRGAFETGKRVHVQICVLKQGESTKHLLCTALIDMYGKCGSMMDAQVVFDTMSMVDLVQWNALITGYAHQGKSELVFCCLQEMVATGVCPDEVTFINVLSVCSHDGLIEQGQMYFEIMIMQCNINPTVKHFGCIVDLLGRVGRLEEAISMLDELHQPDLITWNSVLGACQKLGDIERGEQAFESALRLEDQNSTSFIVMANMYAHFPL